MKDHFSNCQLQFNRTLKSTMQQFNLLLFVIMGFVSIGFTFGNLQCYKCTSDNKSCFDPVNVSNITIENCNTTLFDTPVCLKASTNEFQTILRGCANRTIFGTPLCSSYSSYQKEINNISDTVCSICDSNLCNSSAAIRTTFLVFIGVLFINMIVQI